MSAMNDLMITRCEDLERAGAGTFDELMSKMLDGEIARCSCARNDDGSVTTMLCSAHASNDPCATMSRVIGRRRQGTIKRGTCTRCGWSAHE